MNHSIEQLEKAQIELEDRICSARTDKEYMGSQMPRLVAGHALGIVALKDVEATRNRLAECEQIFTEVPAALLVIKSLIGQARDQEAKALQAESMEQTRRAYIELRDQIIKQPQLCSTNDVAGRLSHLAHMIGGQGKGSAKDEARQLIEAAREYIYERRNTPFSFKLITT